MENENKIILKGFNYTMDKMERYGGNQTQRLSRCCSNYGLSNSIQRQTPDSLAQIAKNGESPKLLTKSRDRPNC